MAIERRVTRSGKVRYRVKIYQNHGVVSSATFDRKGDAEAWESAQKLRQIGGINLAAGKLTVEQYAERWLKIRPQRKYATMYRQESLLKHWVLPKFGSHTVQSITKSDVRAFAVDIQKVKSVDTARLAVGVLRQVLQVAVDDRAISTNPARSVGVGGSKANLPNPLTHEQLHQLSAAFDDYRYSTLVLFLGYCGLRINEAAALNIGDLDVYKRQVKVERSFSLSGPGETRQLSDTKTHASRVVPIPAVVVDRLVELTADREKEYLQPLFYFPEHKINRLNSTSFTKKLRKKCAELKDFPKITPHNLRDTCATLSIAVGANPVEVARLLGHESVAVMFKHYASYFPSGLDDLAERLNNAAMQSLHPRSIPM